MKGFLKNKGLTALLALPLIISCSADDNLTENVRESVERGVILRTLNAGDIGNFLFNTNDPSGSSFQVDFEVQGLRGATNVQDIQFFLDFVDNTDDNGETSTDEILLETIDGASLIESDFGFPSGTFDITFQEALTALNVTNNLASVFGGDQIRTRVVLNLEDGRSFTESDVTGNIESLGSFFSSPFDYRTEVVCIPTSPVPGDYIVTLNDSAGDGFMDATLTVSIDGMETVLTVDPDEFQRIVTITVPDGTMELTFTYNNGNNSRGEEGEHIYNIEAPSGETAAADGPQPSEGTVLLSICSI